MRLRPSGADRPRRCHGAHPDRPRSCLRRHAGGEAAMLAMRAAGEETLRRQRPAALRRRQRRQMRGVRRHYPPSAHCRSSRDTALPGLRERRRGPAGRSAPSDAAAFPNQMPAMRRRHGHASERAGPVLVRGLPVLSQMPMDGGGRNMTAWSHAAAGIDSTWSIRTAGMPNFTSTGWGRGP